MLSILKGRGGRDREGRQTKRDRQPGHSLWATVTHCSSQRKRIVYMLSSLDLFVLICTHLPKKLYIIIDITDKIKFLAAFRANI